MWTQWQAWNITSGCLGIKYEIWQACSIVSTELDYCNAVFLWFAGKVCLLFCNKFGTISLVPCRVAPVKPLLNFSPLASSYWTDQIQTDPIDFQSENHQHARIFGLAKPPPLPWHYNPHPELCSIPSSPGYAMEIVLSVLWHPKSGMLSLQILNSLIVEMMKESKNIPIWQTFN